MKKTNYQTITEYILEKNKDISTSRWLNIKKDNFLESITLDEFKEQITQTALYLRKVGIKKGALVGVISLSTPQWLIFDQAIMLLGAVPVPLFPNTSQENLKFIINQTKLKYIFAYGDEAVKNIVPLLPKLKRVFVYNLNSRKLPTKVAKSKLMNFTEVLAKGKKLAKRSAPIIFNNLKKIKSSDLATIVYTSGSLGVPKGVMLTHANLINQINGCYDFFKIDPIRDRLFTFLPFAHIFERMIIYFYMTVKAPIYFSPFLTQIGNMIREVKPTFMTTVPRLLHKIYEKIYFNVKNSSKAKNVLARNAIRRAENKKVEAPPTLLDKFYDKLVYKKLRRSLGGELKVLMSGGAALDRSLYRFFYNIGIPIREGYGLTETSPVISANKVKQNFPYSVGKNFPNMQVKISKNNEILTKGASVMKGYYRNPRLTKKVMTRDKWFKTGDLGRIENGFLFIEARQKELFKNISGKYIAPVPIESALTKSPYVENAIVIGDNKKYVSALLFLSQENESVLTKQELQQELNQLVAKINQKLNPWERVIRFESLRDMLTVEQGDLTPKMNIRRTVLLKKYKKIVDKLYS